MPDAVETSERSAIRSIVIVGGGAAGWITAGVLAAKYCSREKGSIQPQYGLSSRPEEGRLTANCFITY